MSSQCKENSINSVNDKSMIDNDSIVPIVNVKLDKSNGEIS